MCIVLFINKTTMNKETQLQEIKKSMLELYEALFLAEKNNSAPIIIKALKSAIDGLARDYIEIL